MGIFKDLVILAQNCMATLILSSVCGLKRKEGSGKRELCRFGRGFRVNFGIPYFCINSEFSRMKISAQLKNGRFLRYRQEKNLRHELSRKFKILQNIGKKMNIDDSEAFLASHTRFRFLRWKLNILKY